MTDKQIVKALECCKSYDDLRACYKCPALENGDCSNGKVYISNFILDNTLDLIKRKQRAIEMLRTWDRWLKDENYVPLINKVRAEAIKEFWLELESCTIDAVVFDSPEEKQNFLDFGNYLVKEMTEGK